MTDQEKQDIRDHGPFYASVKSLTFQLKKSGFTFLTVFDGEEDVDVSKKSTQEIAQEICGVDDSRLYVKSPSGSRLMMYIVLGNDLNEIVCDHSSYPLLEEIVQAHYESWSDKKVVYAAQL